MTLKQKLFLSIALALPALAADPETVEFRFEPPVGSVFVATTTHTREVDLGEGPRVDESYGQLKFFTDKLQDERRLKATILGTKIERDGQEIMSPMLKANEGVELIYEFDSAGKLANITGYQGILAKLKQMLPAEFVQQMAPLFNSDGLRKRDMAEWNARIGDMVGEKATIGEVKKSTELFALPTGGTVTLDVERKFAGWVDCGSARCVRIELAYATAEDAVAKLTGTGEKIVDPATMRVYSESSTRTLTGELEVPSKGKKQVKVVEKREYKTTDP